MTRRVLLAAVAVTALVFGVAFLVVGEYWGAAAAGALGAVWLTLEYLERPLRGSDRGYERSPWPGVFFVLFAGLGVAACLGPVAMPVVLLGLCTNLAAWDLSRFLNRIRSASESQPGADVYRRHLSRLGITLGAGYIVALLPVVLRLPLGFVGLFVLALLAVAALRRAILSLRAP